MGTNITHITEDSFLIDIKKIIDEGRRLAYGAVNAVMIKTYWHIGQMQMYVNYYDREVKLADENPTIGILLCHDKDNAVVEYTLHRTTTRFLRQNTKQYSQAKTICGN